MDDDDHPQPGPSLRGRRPPRKVLKLLGEQRDFGMQNLSGSRTLRTNPPMYRQDKTASQTRYNAAGFLQAPQRFNRGLPDNSRGRGARGRHGNNILPKFNRLEPTGDNKNKNYYRNMGFRKLEEIANLDTKDIISDINQRKQAFLEIIGNDIERHDIFTLAIKVLSKVCKSEFDELKFKLILEICNTQFIGTLLKYLLDLPYTDARSKNLLYWNNQEEFWDNLITFCDYIINLSPSTAFTKYRSLVEAAKSCLNNLNEQKAFPSTETHITKLDELRAKITTITVERSFLTNRSDGADARHDVQPPENYRWLNVVPTSVDLSAHTPFLRPNIVDGAYEDVEHYLDVQFRLLREDCFRPLREGVLQYKNDPNRKSYDNIRVFNNVKFIHPYLSHGNVGSVVQMELNQKRTKNFSKIKWEYNKRFIFGSLVLFTKDNCRSFLAATILDRDPALLSQGKIPVCLTENKFDIDFYNRNDSYLMIESEVYFEPYYHVMKAMQEPSFSEKFPMQQYIVKVQPEHKPPAYLLLNQNFIFDISIDTDDDSSLLGLPRETMTKYDVTQPDTWPSKEKMRFDESQYEAFKHALTHEFAVIQGPPGTGKTFIGLKITKALLDNLSHIKGCLILVICYTNHALDQFLGGILNYTKSIVRIGGQSKDIDLEELNLSKLRSKIPRRSASYDLYMEQKTDIDMSIKEFQNSLRLLNVITNGILKTDSLKKEVEEIRMLEQCYNTCNDVLYAWLFGNRAAFITDFEECLLKYGTEDDVSENVKEETKRRKQNLLAGHDDDDDSALDEICKNEASFSLKLHELTLKKLVSEYKKVSPNNIEQSHDIRNRIVFLNSEITMFKAMSELTPQRVNRRIGVGTNFQNIPTEERWLLYFQWVRPKIESLKAHVANLQQSFESKRTAFEESRMLLDLEILNQARVIGMTTSGAARLRKLIKSIGPPIVIIEEAAEVLEQHIITSLTHKNQHVILIGDQQQLRPSASHMKLARQFNLEVSLFERMVTNGIHSRRLGVQHRMRPEIAALISPSIYADLLNHASVLNKPDVQGIRKNLFFFTHQHQEDVQTDGSKSRSNFKEADLTLALANYIMMQGYSPEDVTILTTYTGQMFYLRKERGKYLHLQNVKITVVDNYQGEESKIILLSLVRNNEKGEIGFLGTENRICVALSRAQEGFYIFGNIDVLRSKSTLWQKVAITLEVSESVGPSLELMCEQHPNYVSYISTVEDFEKVPEGGCNQLCNKEMMCGHVCNLLCHGYDRHHNTERTKCQRECDRSICNLDHACPRRCWQECEPCQVLVKKSLPCGHEVDVPCHLDPDEMECPVLVPCTLPDCGHEGQKQCHEKVERVVCRKHCIYRLECGHACTKCCHVNDDPEHANYKCTQRCERPKKDCSTARDNDTELGEHACNKQCYQPCDSCYVQVYKKRSNCKHVNKVACCDDVDKEPCRKKCARALPCGHFCKKKCFEPCGDCSDMTTKLIPDCGHEVRMLCKLPPTRDKCLRKCERLLSCGHACKDFCANICDSKTCKEPSSCNWEAPCGHRVEIPCNMVEPITTGVMSAETLLAWCSAACGAQLACGHACAGTCAACRQRRLHVPCAQPCGRRLICGHNCTEPCNQVCPPCERACEVKCAHSRCANKCGEPCTPCKEKCSRQCPHGACARLCGQACSAPPCDRACPRALPCGHACRGLCGEPCPDACKLCRPDSFPKGLIGEDFEDDDRLIKLLDCGHILSVDDADNYMNVNREEIHIRTCPLCRTPIINTNRYKDIVNNSFKNEIGPIKRKIYGDTKEINERKKKLLNEYEVANLPSKVDGSKCLENKHFNLDRVMKQKKRESLQELDMKSIYLNILNLTANCYVKYTNEKSMELKEELENQIKLICSVLDIKKRKWWVVSKISEQQQTDVFKEIKRLNLIVQFSLMLSHETYKHVRQNPKVVVAYKCARATVFSAHVLKEEDAIESLKKLQEVVKGSGVLSLEEIRMVIRSVKDVPVTGHWFKCPNGHFYAIGECGGAMETSRCVDCGASVGGSSHRLLSDNAHAREIDGSRFPKYSEEYNNMANFNLDFE